jgi:cell division transport system permease protein
VIGWLSQHAQAMRGALRKLAAQRAASLFNMLVIGIAISLPLAGYVLLDNLQGVAARFSLEPQLSLFLAPGTPPSERDALQKKLKSDARVSAVRFVSRQEALEGLRKTEGIAEVVSALNENPLPDAFLVKLRRVEPRQLEALSAELGKSPGVAHVQADSDWARRLAALIEIGRLGLLLAGALLATGLVAVTFNTIRLQVLTQREEIVLAKLLGATDAHIRRPFYYLGAFQGLVGGVIGLAILGGGLLLLNRGVRALSESYGSNFQFAFPTGPDGVAVVALASVVGWLGAYLSVSIYLRAIGPR